jgi:hypothetical protein
LGVHPEEKNVRPKYLGVHPEEKNVRPKYLDVHPEEKNVRKQAKNAYYVKFAKSFNPVGVKSW